MLDIVGLRQQFKSLFPEVDGGAQFAVTAPGRVNLIGEHVDYNNGIVCPIAIDRSTIILCSPRADKIVRMHSLSTSQTIEFAIDQPIERARPSWSLYPRGAAEAMRRRACIFRGMDAVVASDIPIGGGLSSSAAFEVATALAILAVNRTCLDPLQIALACQWAEHHYANMPCGIMDQFASVMAERGHALLIDCRTQAIRQLPIADPDLRIVISNCGVRHELVSGEYKARRNQCETALAYLRQRHAKLTSLRDASLYDLEESRLGMDSVAFKRARHVITEIARTTQFAEALGMGDYAACGMLMYESHKSLQDDYGASCDELDALVEIARGTRGVYGSRMTGGGFGGCTVSLCTADGAERLAAAIETEYPKVADGTVAAVFVTVPSAGAATQRLESTRFSERPLVFMMHE